MRENRRYVFLTKYIKNKITRKLTYEEKQRILLYCLEKINDCPDNTDEHRIYLKSIEKLNLIPLREGKYPTTTKLDGGTANLLG